MNKEFLSSTFNMVGGVSGILSLGLIIWNGGALWQTVKDHTRRIENMESSGSIGLREHVKLDDERVKELQAQQALDREIRSRLLTQVTDLSADVKVMTSKLDALKEQVSNIKR